MRQPVFLFPRPRKGVEFLQSKYQALKAAIPLVHFLDNIRYHKGADCSKITMHSVKAGEKLFKKPL